MDFKGLKGLTGILILVLALGIGISFFQESPVGAADVDDYKLSERTLQEFPPLQNKQIISHEVSDGFSVIWYPVANDIVHKEYLITVQNLLDSDRDFNFTVFFSNSTIDVAEIENIITEEYRNVTSFTTTMTVSCNSYNSTDENGTSREVRNCTAAESVAEVNAPKWSPVKELFSKTENNKKSAEYGLVNIDKFGSAKRDQTYNGTKIFRLSFGTPFKGLSGSIGLVGIEHNGNVYHPWWNSSLTYRAKITITNNLNKNLTNQQIRIIVNTSHLINAGKMQPNCWDGKFVNSTETGLLNYWRQDGTCNSNVTLYHVNVTFIRDNANTEIFFYYGNTTSVSDSSSMNNTFELGDNFSSANLDSRIWTVHEGGVSFSNETLVLNSVQYDKVKSVGTWGANHTLAYRMRSPTDRRIETGLSTNTATGTGTLVTCTVPAQFTMTYRYVAGGDEYHENCGSSDNQTSSSTVKWTNEWNITKLEVIENVHSRWERSLGNSTTNVININYATVPNQFPDTTSSMRIWMSCRDWGCDANFDWIYLAKYYNDTQVTYSIGQEETEGNANETAGDAAIVQGIINALGSSAPIYTDQQIYTRNSAGTHKTGTFDKVASSGSKRWTFNYVTANESYQNLGNITPSFYTQEMSNMLAADITTLVENFISNTS